MNILTVTHFYESHGGGIERVAARLNAEFSHMGHDASWAASDADALPDDPVKAIPLRCVNPTEKLTGLPMPIPGPRAIRALSRSVRQSDAVVIHDALYVTSILAMALAKWHRKPALLVQHIAAIPFASWTMRRVMALANRMVTRPMLAMADRRVFISDVVRRALIGDPPARSFALLFNGIDTAIFHPESAEARGAVRARHDLPAGAPLAIFVGRFVTKKGLSIIEAVARICPDLHVALVGEGPVDPSAWRLPNVHILGRLPQPAIAALYQASDMLLLPSVGEGYPLVVQEAMACGLPVICGEESARADPGAHSWLHGVEVDLADPIASAARCAVAIDRIADEPADRDRVARYAAEHYNWRHMAERIVETLSVAVDAHDMAPRRR